jgi:transcription termination factor Rho
MAIGINEFGIVDAADRERVIIRTPHPNGGPAKETEIPESTLKDVRLETGDVAQWESGTDRILQINNLPIEKAAVRPTPRESRNQYERVRPSRWIPIGTFIDFAAPMGMGYAGIIHGPHGSGLTQILHEVARGFRANAPDILPIILLTQARGEEITHWRRSFPEADVVVSASSEADPLHALVLEAALRQTELGRHVLIAVDSLSGLWASMLETEEADAQREADTSHSRRGIREWFQKAGDFTGEGFLGSGIGGSLTIIGTAWNRAVDTEAEEEGELHPELRLFEHILPESTWQIALSSELAAERIYPAIHLARCLSRDEENFLRPDRYDRLLAARQFLLSLPLKDQHAKLTQAAAESVDFDSLIASLADSEHARPKSFNILRKLLGGD